MRVNSSIKKLEEVDEFLTFKKNLVLESGSCNESLFIFNNDIAFIITDTVNDYEIDILMYDRELCCCTLNMYGVAEHILKTDEIDQINNLADFYLGVIDFNVLQVFSEEKKKSLSFFLGLMNSVGERVLSIRADKHEELYRQVIAAVSSKWESCINQILAAKLY